MAQTLTSTGPAATRWAQYYALTKPRVVQLIVFCALIGMLLARAHLHGAAVPRRGVARAQAQGA